VWPALASVLQLLPGEYSVSVSEALKGERPPAERSAGGVKSLSPSLSSLGQAFGLWWSVHDHAALSDVPLPTQCPGAGSTALAPCRLARAPHRRLVYQPTPTCPPPSRHLMRAFLLQGCQTR
jgi:hypothetical protein